MFLEHLPHEGAEGDENGNHNGEAKKGTNKSKETGFQIPRRFVVVKEQQVGQ
jgi:hypothetical protein